MLKVVSDTNVLLSAITHMGKPRQLIDSTLGGKAVLLVSTAILREFEKVIATEKSKLSKSQQAYFVESVSALTRVVQVRNKF